MEPTEGPTEFLDAETRLSIEAPTASRATLRLHAVGTGVAAVVELTAAAATWLATALHGAAGDAVAGADFPPPEN